nr:DALR anticodon-binding domain-containing protein [Streptomonospora nanhaiensis]
MPLRVAARARRPARGLAEAAAAHLRRHPLVADAAAEGPGFVAVTPAAPAWSALVARVAADPGTYLGGYLARPFASVPSADSGHLDDLDGLVGPDHPPDPERPGPAGPPDAGAPGTWAPLADAPTVAEARLRARAAARRRIAAADRLLPALAEGRGRMPGGGPGGAEVSWRDPCLDRGPDGFTTAAGRLLGVIGEASARVAFCRSAGERPRPGELTGPDLPALPTAERPGAWARSTFDNPAFAVRYARAHALSTLRWAGAAHPPAPGDTPSPAPGGAGPAPGAADGGAAAAPPARPGRPPSGTAPPAPRAALIGALFDGPVVVRAAERRSEPHMLVRYLEGLAIAYHDWWESSGVLRGETARGSGGDDALALCAAVAGVLGSGLSLLGVSAPTRL